MAVTVTVTNKCWWSRATAGLVLRAFGVLGVDDVVLATGLRRRGALALRSGRGFAAGGRTRGAAVEGLSHLVRRLLQPLECALEHRCFVRVAVVLDRVLGVLEGRLQLGSIALRDLVPVLVEVLLHLERQRLQLVARVDRLAAFLVFRL